MILLNIFGIFFLIGAIHWLQRISDSCDCSKDWRRTYLFYYYYFAILLNIVSIQYPGPRLMALMFLLTTVGASITLSYLVDMRKKQCRCLGANEKILFAIAVAQVILTGGTLAYLSYRAYTEKKIKLIH